MACGPSRGSFLFTALCSAGVAVLSVGCGGHAKTPAGLTQQQVDAERGTCSFKPGMLASQTLPGSYPTGTALPINHIILVMQENRSFDSYFSALNLPGLDVASPTATNPDANGNPVQRFHQTSYCFDDTSHSWGNVHNELDGTMVDGFVKANAGATNDPTGTRAMGYYDESDLPFYYALARTFSISDRHFCSVLGPTYPNRMFYMAGTSFGLTGNSFPPASDPKGNPYPNIFTEMDAGKVSWKVYSQDVPTPLIFANVYGTDTQNFVGQNTFDTDVMSGSLPSVSMVEGTDSAGGLSVDEHPPADMQVGQAFVADIVNTVMHSNYWKDTAIFITYDEHGGQYDHVVPPAACKPDDLPPDNGDPAGFNQLGFRVPFLVVSPYAKRGHISHEVTDHTSILRFVEDRFNLPAMTYRDANAEPPYDMFDFKHPDFSVPDLPPAPIDQTQQSTCASMYPKTKSQF